MSTALASLQGTPVTGLSARNQAVCALKKSDMNVVCFGTPWPGSPSDVPAGLGPVSMVSAGTDSTCAILASGVVSCWGYGGDAAKSVPSCFPDPAFGPGEY